MDFASYFADTAALSVAIIAIVAFLKEHILTSLEGAYTIIASLVIGAALGIAGNFLGYVEGGIVMGAVFGVSAGFIASGGWDALQALLGKR